MSTSIGSGGPQTPKRGALPTPRSVLATAMPHAALGAPPNYIVIPNRISMWGNDVHGDCVTAEEAFAKACYQPEIFISDQEVINWATQHGVLEGAYIYQVLDWMRNDGFRQDGQIYNDGSRFSVDWTQSSILTSAIAQGPVKIGVAADQLQNVWGGDVVAGSLPDSARTLMKTTALLSAGTDHFMVGAATKRSGASLASMERSRAMRCSHGILSASSTHRRC